MTGVTDVVVMVVLFGALVLGAGLLRQEAPVEKEAEPLLVEAPPRPAPPPPQRVIFAGVTGRDRLGDPLPGDAVARLGDVRFRQIGDYYTARFSHDGKLLAQKPEVQVLILITKKIRNSSYWHFRWPRGSAGSS